MDCFKHKRNTKLNLFFTFKVLHLHLLLVLHSHSFTHSHTLACSPVTSESMRLCTSSLSASLDQRRNKEFSWPDRTVGEEEEPFVAQLVQLCVYVCVCGWVCLFRVFVSCVCVFVCVLCSVRLMALDLPNST